MDSGNLETSHFSYLENFEGCYEGEANISLGPGPQVCHTLARLGKDIPLKRFCSAWL